MKLHYLTEFRQRPEKKHGMKSYQKTGRKASESKKELFHWETRQCLLFKAQLQRVKTEQCDMTESVRELLNNLI